MLIAACIVLALAHAPLVGAPADQRGAGANVVAPVPPRAGVIAGRVIDAVGHPVPGTYVSALFPAGRDRRFSNESTEHGTITDERGEFRLEALGSRDFYLVAIPHSTTADAARQTGSAITFYPSTLAPDEARTIRLTRLGQARVEIVLRSTRLSVVSGRVFASTGNLVGGGRLELDHLDGLYGFDSRVVNLAPNGTFQVPGLPPGSYFLQYREAGSATGAPYDWKVSRAKVRVVDRDVTDVQVLPVTMVRVTGRIVVSAEDRSAIAPSIIRVAAWPADSDDNPGPQSVGNVKPDWTFEFYTWPGVGRVRVDLRTSSPAFAVSGVRLNGLDVLNKDVTFLQDQPLAGLEVELIRR